MEDHTIADFGDALRERLTHVMGRALVGAYLHGSAALGGFQPGASDLDLLVVVNGRWHPDMREGVARSLQRSHGSSPGRGIEASVIRDEVAQSGGRRTDFEVHVTTDPADRKVVTGALASGDPDLILHMAVCRQSAITVLGPDPLVVFAEVDPTLVVGQMIEELTWALAQGSEAYAVLNACRARFYLEHRMFCSKLEGGRWARNRFDAVALIDRSLAAQEGHGDDQPPHHSAGHSSTELSPRSPQRSAASAPTDGPPVRADLVRSFGGYERTTTRPGDSVIEFSPSDTTLRGAHEEGGTS